MYIGCARLGNILKSNNGVNDLDVCGHGESESCLVEDVGIVDKRYNINYYRH